MPYYFDESALSYVDYRATSLNQAFVLSTETVTSNAELFSIIVDNHTAPLWKYVLCPSLYPYFPSLSKFVLCPFRLPSNNRTTPSSKSVLCPLPGPYHALLSEFVQWPSLITFVRTEKSENGNDQQLTAPAYIAENLPTSIKAKSENETMDWQKNGVKL